MNILLRRIFTFLILTLIMAEGNCEVQVESKITSQVAFDTNPRTRPVDPDEVVVSITDIEVLSTYLTETSSVSLQPAFRLSKYSQETDLNNEDYFVTLSGNKLYERMQFSGEFSYEREASIRTELEDSGIFNVNVPRTSFSAFGAGTFFATPRLSFQLFGNGLYAFFEDNPRSTFIDYQNYALGSSLRYIYSDQTAWTVIFSASDFKTPEISSKTRSYAFQVGFEHEFDESLRANFSVGRNISHLRFKDSQLSLISVNPILFGVETIDREERSSGDILDLTIEKEFERSFVKVEWNRQFSPASRGARQEREEVQGFGRYRITRNLWLEGLLNYRERRQEGTTNTLRFNDFEVIKAVARVYYRFSRNWLGQVGFRYREQTRVDTGIAADSERYFVSLRYSPNKISFRP